MSRVVGRANVSFERDKSLAGDRLRELTDADFVARWREIVGEPPSIMLDDRREMIAILVAASGAPAGEPAPHDDPCPLNNHGSRWAA